MRVAHRALTETTMNGSTQAVETKTDSTKTWKVVALDDAGRATLEHSVDDVTMTSRTSDRGEIRWTSRGEAEPPPGYEGVRQSLGVPLSRLVVDRSGRIIERRDLRPCPPSTTGDMVVVPSTRDGAVSWHLLQLLAIKVLQGTGLPLGEIQARLYGRTDAELEAIWRAVETAEPAFGKPAPPTPVAWREVTIVPGLKILASDEFSLDGEPSDALRARIEAALAVLGRSSDAASGGSGPRTTKRGPAR
jgi:hypothetical protein